MPGLKGKNVLVTGGSSGIGQAIAVRFAEHGANVAINYLTTPDEAQDTEEQVHACVHRVRQEGVRDVLVQGDVSDEDDVVRMVGMAAEELGGIDVLINNAGIQISRPSTSSPAPTSTRSSPSTCAARSCARARRSSSSSTSDKGGSIINVSSVHQAHPEARLPGLLVLEGRDDEPDPHARPGVRRPRDPRQRHRPGRDDHADQLAPGSTTRSRRSRSRATSRCGRAGTADEMGGVACFLASDDAAYITGQTIFVDGGLTLYPSFREPWSSE